MFPKNSLSPLAGWAMMLWISLMEGSYIGGLIYELNVQHESTVGNSLDALWMAAVIMPFTGIFVAIFGSLPMTVLYVVLRTSSLKHNLRLDTRLLTGFLSGTVAFLLFVALTRFKSGDWRELFVVLIGIEASSVAVMITLRARWLGVTEADRL